MSKWVPRTSSTTWEPVGNAESQAPCLQSHWIRIHFNKDPGELHAQGRLSSTALLLNSLLSWSSYLNVCDNHAWEAFKNPAAWVPPLEVLVLLVWAVA